MNDAAAFPRKPWNATVLSLLCTGLGQIYCGRLVRGLVMFLLSLLFAPLVVLAALQRPSTALLIVLVIAGFAIVALYVVSVVDAFRLAWNSRHQFESREYNAVGLYALFVLVGLTYPVFSMLYLRGHVIEAFIGPESSMSPNFLAGDRFLVNKLATRLRAPRRGDVVVFHTPANRQLTWIKRVIALPGDTVAVRGRDVFVNGKKLERDPVPYSSLAFAADDHSGEFFEEINSGHRYKIQFTPTTEAPAEFAEQKVPDGFCFVLGDSRNRSADSRSFGLVPLGDILGYVEYIYYPAQNWTRFGAYVDG